MEEDFYATIKLKNSEEIFAKVVFTEENNNNLLLVNNPIVISKFKSRTGIEGYKIEPWIKTTSEDLFILNFNDILTMTESKDIEIILMHQEYCKNMGHSQTKHKPLSSKISRKMGYISTVNDAKKLLEDIYKNS